MARQLTGQLSLFADAPLSPEAQQFMAKVRYLDWLHREHPDTYERVAHDPRAVHIVPPGQAA
jgi:hypothetical protein